MADVLITDPEKIDALLMRGVAEVIGGERLRERLLAGECLRVKLGVDPTSPNLHLGRSVPLLKLRDFQELGHTVIFLVGDFTGTIGDTSDKESERPMLSQETVDANKETYFAQVGKLINLEKAELRYNSEWLGSLTYGDICLQADAFSVADFIARENIKKRLDAGTRVSLREVLYPLMQGYDSVALKADVELGGTDQRFNLLAGRALEEKAGMEPQAVIMNPLVAGLDGRKMSSSWGNTINFTDEPHDMFGKIMSARDELTRTYFEAFTRVPLPTIEAAMALHPKEAKARLAHEIVRMYHGEAQAQKAEADFENTFARSEFPDDAAEIHAREGEALGDALVRAGIVSSKNDWRRLVESGAVSIHGGEKISDSAVPARAGNYRIGKHRFVRVVA